MSKRILRIGIASRDEIRQRTIEIASGRRRRQPDEPRVWFTSIDAFARVLSGKSMLLLEMIRQSEPDSVSELAQRLGRQKPNVSRILKRLNEFGIVEFEIGKGGKKAPRVRYDVSACDAWAIHAPTREDAPMPRSPALLRGLRLVSEASRSPRGNKEHLGIVGKMTCSCQALCRCYTAPCMSVRIVRPAPCRHDIGHTSL